MKLYMFRTVPLSIIRSYSLYTQQWCTSMPYRFVDSFRAGLGWNCREFHPDPAHGFTIRIFVTMHGHMNVKSEATRLLPLYAFVTWAGKTLPYIPFFLHRQLGYSVWKARFEPRTSQLEARMLPLISLTTIRLYLRSLCGCLSLLFPPATLND
jgi:hypothetical protein